MTTDRQGPHTSETPDISTEAAACRLESQAVLAQLRGEGWHCRAWNAGGWHWVLEREFRLDRRTSLHLSVHRSGERVEARYYALLGYKAGTGEMNWSSGMTYTDPQKAVDSLLNFALVAVRRDLRNVEAVSEAMKGDR